MCYKQSVGLFKLLVWFRSWVWNNWLSQVCNICLSWIYWQQTSGTASTCMCFIKRGVQRTPTTEPRYVLIWDIQTVLDFVKYQWSGCGLSDKVLIYKLVILMALSSASRASAINHLDVRYMLRIEGKFVFTFHKLHKSWKYVWVYKAYISAAHRKKDALSYCWVLFSHMWKCLVQLPLNGLRKL